MNCKENVVPASGTEIRDSSGFSLFLLSRMFLAWFWLGSPSLRSNLEV